VQGAEKFSYRARFYLAREKNRPLSAQGELFWHLVMEEHSGSELKTARRPRRAVRNSGVLSGT
jgi:hypothetical protein